MNREIKFRAWVYSGFYEMINDYCFLDNSDFSFMGHDRTNNRYDVIDVMQFTGLYDSEGKEIYEGDVLQAIERVKYVVVFRDGGYKLKDDSLWTLFGLINYHKCKVIGNIYENPDLIS